ncbi:hypothetical protein FUAX_16190 [Fulvitalea axinellae]|uniref:DUF4175 family protein n=1 Tax=Fulvitalea axinellae TaxID=1182444 RepID=A0AAU9CUR8_9BACT|nr:hypothetical protein FUAX_16190 [Fulvitalea axinellae]
MKDSSKDLRSVLSKIRSGRRRRVLAWAFLLALVAVSTVFLASSVVDRIYYYNTIQKVLALVGILALGFVIIFRYGWRPFRRMSLKSIAKGISKRQFDSHQLFMTALDLVERKDEEGVSPELRAKVMEEAGERLEVYMKSEKMDVKSKQRSIIIGFSVWTFFILLFWGHGASTHLKRLLNPWKEISYLKVEVNGPEFFLAGTAPKIVVKTRGRALGKGSGGVKLHYSEDGENWKIRRLTKGKTRQSRMSFVAKMKGLDHGIRYYATYGDGKSEERFLALKSLPKVDTAYVTVHFPEYMGLDPEIRQGGAMEVPEGSTVSVKVRTSQRMKNVEFVLPDGKVTASIDVNVATAEFPISSKTEGTYTVTGTDVYGERLRPATYNIVCVQDHGPKVKVIDPASDLSLTSVTELPIRFFVMDDYGVSTVGVNAVVDGKEVEVYRKKLKGKPQREYSATAKLLLENFELDRKTDVRFYAWANDTRPGKVQQGVSELRSIDIRPFREKYFMNLQNAQGGSGDESRDEEMFYKLDELVQAQRKIVSDAFKGYKEKVSVESAKSIAPKQEDVKKATKDFRESLNRMVAKMDVLDASMGDMSDAIRGYSQPNWATGYTNSDKALKKLVGLREEMAYELGKKKQSECTSQKTSASLSELALDVDMLIRKQEMIKRNNAKSKPETKTLRKEQRMLRQETRELKASLEIHPDGLKENMDQADRVIGHMRDSENAFAVNKSATGHIDNSITELKKWAKMLRATSQARKPEEMLAEAVKKAEKALAELEKNEMKRKSFGRSKSSGKGSAESEAMNDSDSKKKGKKGGEKGEKKEGKMGKGNPGGSGSGSSGGKSEGSTSATLADLGEHLAMMEKWVNSGGENGDSGQGNERMEELAKKHGFKKLAEELKKAKGDNAVMDERMRTQLRKLATGLKSELLRRTMSRLERLNVARDRARKLKDGLDPKNAEANKQALKSELASLDDAELESLSWRLGNSPGRGVYEGIERKITALMSEMLSDKSLSGKDVEVPEEYKKLVDKYFKILSDDM